MILVCYTVSIGKQEAAVLDCLNHEDGGLSLFRKFGNYQSTRSSIPERYGSWIISIPSCYAHLPIDLSPRLEPHYIRTKVTWRHHSDLYLLLIKTVRFGTVCTHYSIKKKNLSLMTSPRLSPTTSPLNKFFPSNLRLYLQRSLAASRLRQSWQQRRRGAAILIKESEAIGWSGCWWCGNCLQCGGFLFVLEKGLMYILTQFLFYLH